MNRRFLIAILAVAAVAVPIQAQNQQRRATMVGGGSPERGKCTVEIVVDGQAVVEIRGDTATLRNLQGNPPQWRRFECTGPLPVNPADFRFNGVDGRGRQELIRDPRNGGTAAVQIEDPQGGSEGYTFDIQWSNGGGPMTQGPGRPGVGMREDGRFGQPEGPDGRMNAQPYSQADAVRSCEESVRQVANSQRIDARDIAFRRVETVDNPGARDSVSGMFDVRQNGRDVPYRFSCAVNLESGRVFNAQILPFRGDYGEGRDGGNRAPQFEGGNPATRALQSCRRSVEQRIVQEGYGNVFIDSIRTDDRPGRNDWVLGSARAEERADGDRAGFDFSCSVDLNDGDVRSVEVRRR